MKLINSIITTKNKQRLIASLLQIIFEIEQHTNVHDINVFRIPSKL